jgi:predicted phage-related endonuclease
MVNLKESREKFLKSRFQEILAGKKILVPENQEDILNSLLEAMNSVYSFESDAIICAMKEMASQIKELRDSKANKRRNNSVGQAGLGHLEEKNPGKPMGKSQG